MPDITHIVYVDPEAYTGLKEKADLLAVGEAVGRLADGDPIRTASEAGS